MRIWGGLEAFMQHKGDSGHCPVSKVTCCLCRSLRSDLKAKHLSQYKTKPFFFFLAGSAERQTNFPLGQDRVVV